MDADQARATAERLRQALDMMDAGISMKRAQLRRQYPDASEEENERRLRDWLGTRPGAEHGDAIGRPRAVDTGMS